MAARLWSEPGPAKVCPVGWGGCLWFHDRENCVPGIKLRAGRDLSIIRGITVFELNVSQVADAG